MTRIVRILGGGMHGRSRAALVVGIVAVAGGIAVGSLMATGCFQGEAAIVGPTDDTPAAELAAQTPDVNRVLATLDAAVAEGKVPAEFAAMIRAKIESGEAQLYSAVCTPDGDCELPIDCPPGDCTTSAACVELTGSGEGEPACVVIECDEADCGSLCPPGASGSANCCPDGDSI
jgi:hypothetical protein